jgi:hypothetical protein
MFTRTATVASTRSAPSRVGQIIVAEEQKSKAIFDFFNDILGVPAPRVSSLNLDLLDLPHSELGNLGDRFSEAEVLAVVRSLPPDKALGHDGFTNRFLQSTWEIIRGDIMAAFDTFCHMDTRNLCSVNDALLTLIPRLLRQRGSRTTALSQ